MTAMELRVSLLKEVSTLLDDEEMIRSAIKALRSVRNTVSSNKEKEKGKRGDIPL